MYMADKQALVKPSECRESRFLLWRSAQMTSFGFKGLGTVLRISFLECKSLAVNLWFIFLNRVAGIPQLASTWDSVPVLVPRSGQKKKKKNPGPLLLAMNLGSWRMVHALPDLLIIVLNPIEALLPSTSHPHCNKRQKKREEKKNDLS